MILNRLKGRHVVADHGLLALALLLCRLQDGRRLCTLRNLPDCFPNTGLVQVVARRRDDVFFFVGRKKRSARRGVRLLTAQDGVDLAQRGQHQLLELVLLVDLSKVNDVGCYLGLANGTYDSLEFVVARLCGRVDWRGLPRAKRSIV